MKFPINWCKSWLLFLIFALKIRAFLYTMKLFHRLAEVNIEQSEIFRCNLILATRERKKGNECLCLFVSKGLANANKFKTHIFFKRFLLVSSTIFASKTRFDSWMVSQKIRLSCRFPALQTIFDSIKSYNCSRTRDNLYLSFFSAVLFVSFHSLFQCWSKYFW